jgi:hypothetical protein
MISQAQRIADLTATIANHRKVGNTEMADRMQAKLDMYSEMTEREYVEHEIAVMSKSNFFQVRRAADRLARELLGA